MEGENSDQYLGINALLNQGLIEHIAKIRQNDNIVSVFGYTNLAKGGNGHLQISAGRKEQNLLQKEGHPKSGKKKI